MTVNREKIQNLLERLKANVSLESVAERLSPKSSAAKPRLRHAKTLDEANIKKHWEILKAHTGLSEEDQRLMADPLSLGHIEAYSNNIENCIGTVKLPVGVAGPLRVNGLFAQDDYYLPLATTEAALVASYSRGARIITEAFYYP